MGSRQRYVYRTKPQEFPADFSERLERFRQAGGFSWRGLARELRVNAETVRRWKAGAAVSSGHLVNLLELAAGMGLLHHLLRGVADSEVSQKVASQDVHHDISFNTDAESTGQVRGEDTPELRPGLPTPGHGIWCRPS